MTLVESIQPGSDSVTAKTIRLKHTEDPFVKRV